MEATLTVRRPNQDLTVALEEQAVGWVITGVVDEDGNPATLTKEERAEVVARAEAGEDETGY